jgi:hypothetical protein
MMMTDKHIHLTTVNLLKWWGITKLSISEQLTCWRDDDWQNYPFHDRQQTIKILLTSLVAAWKENNWTKHMSMSWKAKQKFKM